MGLISKFDHAFLHNLSVKGVVLVHSVSPSKKFLLVLGSPAPRHELRALCAIFVMVLSQIVASSPRFTRLNNAKTTSWIPRWWLLSERECRQTSSARALPLRSPNRGVLATKTTVVFVNR